MKKIAKFIFALAQVKMKNDIELTFKKFEVGDRKIQEFLKFHQNKTDDFRKELASSYTNLFYQLRREFLRLAVSIKRLADDRLKAAYSKKLSEWRKVFQSPSSNITLKKLIELKK